MKICKLFPADNLSFSRMSSSEGEIKSLKSGTQDLKCVMNEDTVNRDLITTKRDNAVGVGRGQVSVQLRTN